MKKILIALLIMLIIAVTAFIVVNYYGIGSRSSVQETQSTVIQEDVEMKSDLVKSGLRNIGELATEEYYYTGVESYESIKTVNGRDIAFTESSCIYSYDGLIKAGIDFADIEVEKDDLRRLITVTLPYSRILSSEIDENSFQIYDEKSSIFNPTSFADMNKSIAELKKTASEKALEKGVLDRADEHAEEIIQNFINGIWDTKGYDYTFIHK